MEKLKEFSSNIFGYIKNKTPLLLSFHNTNAAAMTRFCWKAIRDFCKDPLSISAMVRLLIAVLFVMNEFMFHYGAMRNDSTSVKLWCMLEGFLLALLVILFLTELYQLRDDPWFESLFKCVKSDYSFLRTSLL